jgi:hypothetical protein
MISFLPSVFPTAITPIPHYNKHYEQRSEYPYIFTSTVLMEDHLKHERTYTKDTSVQSQVLPVLAQPITSQNQPEPNTLTRLMVNMLDPLTVLYSAEWLKEIDIEFRDTIRSFLADEANSRVLGKTRCRDCLYYFEKSLVKPSKTRVKSIGVFLSFWWGIPVTINGVSYPWKKTQSVAPVQSNAIVLTHLDNGQWKMDKMPIASTELKK